MPRYDSEFDNFVVTCKKCGSTFCRTYRDYNYDLKGECEMVCMDCGTSEFCDAEEE